jgi:MFS family permease
MAQGKGRARGSAVETTAAAEAMPTLPRAFPQLAAAALVFVAAGAVLMLEILAVRLLAPYVGLTLQTTTSIIGAALAGIAVGAALGGYFADRTNTRLLVVGLLIGGGLLTLLTVPIVRWLGPGARESGELAALGITVVSLVPAAAVLSAVSPAVAHLQLHDLRASGTIVGRLSAFATAGALIGTFGTGFVVIPLVPVGTAVLAIGIALVLAGIVLAGAARLLTPAAVAGVAIVTVAMGAFAGAADSPCLRETDYHCIELEADPNSSSGYELILDNSHNSYVDLKDPTDLNYVYTRWIAEAIDQSYPPPDPLDAVFVGGGGFTLPRWLLATHPGSQAQVLEVDGGLVDFDEERLGLRTSPQLRVSVGDARVTMRKIDDDSADVVVGDAFSGYSVPWHLTTVEWLSEVKRVLKPGGIYTLNMIDLPPLDLVKAEAATLLDAFADVRFVTYADENGAAAGGNIVLLASDRRLPKAVVSKVKGSVTYTQEAMEKFVGGAEPLRDDFAPVDQLRTEG